MLDAEFDRQLSTLIELGYPALAGVSPAEFTTALGPLQKAIDPDLPPPTRARVPFVIVLGRRYVRPSQAMPLTVHNGRSGFVAKDTEDIDEFPTRPEVELPGDAWLVLDVDRGAATIGATPDEARARFERQGRTPLTIEEGIALLTQFPDVLEKNNCFQLPGTQRDRRVPGIWISQRAAKLGYCWAGNRHTWLGHASAARRVASPA